MPPRSKKGVASLADVARRAGVSAQTVSRVVNGSASVSPETLAKVQDAMAELNYRPSFAGRSLKAGKYRAVGLAMFNNIKSTGNVYRLDGIARAAMQTGHALTLIEMDIDGNGATLGEAAFRMSELPVDGLIFNLSRMVPDFRQFVPPIGLKTVIATVFDHPYCSTVDNDHYGCSETIVDYLLSKGHRTVYHVAGNSQSVASQQREYGWYDALVNRDIEPPSIYRGDWSGASGYAAGVELAKRDDCTAVYASNDAMALGVVCALRDSGKRVPEDVSVVGVDDSLSDILPHDGITSMRLDNKAVGDWAFKKAIGLDENPDAKEHVLIPGELIERASVAAGPRL